MTITTLGVQHWPIEQVLATVNSSRLHILTVGVHRGSLVNRAGKLWWWVSRPVLSRRATDIARRSGRHSQGCRVIDHLPPEGEPHCRGNGIRKSRVTDEGRAGAPEHRPSTPREKREETATCLRGCPRVPLSWATGERRFFDASPPAKLHLDHGARLYCYDCSPRRSRRPRRPRPGSPLFLDTVEEARVLHDPEGLPPATSIAFDRDFSSSALG